MGNTSNKKELNLGLERIIVKILTNFPTKHLQKPVFLASKLYFHRLLQIINADKGGELRDVKNMQGAFKEIESFANLIYEQKDNSAFFEAENPRFKEVMNLLIKKLRILSYIVEVSEKNMENLDSITEEINVHFSVSLLLRHFL